MSIEKEIQELRRRAEAASEALHSITDRQPGKPKAVKTDDSKPMQIRVPVEKHTEIKAYAAEQQMSITDLLLMAYEEYRQRHK